MNPEDDPEARIRELERPLSDQARASELGAGATELGSGGVADENSVQHPNPGAAPAGYGYVPGAGYSGGPSTPPPVYTSTSDGLPPPLPPPPPPPPGAWGSYPPSSSPGAFGTFNPTVRTASASFRLGWLMFGIFAVVGVIVGGGVWMAFSQVNQGLEGIKTAFPSTPSVGVGTVAPTTPTASAGGTTISVAGANKHQTVVCDGGAVSVSGVDNTIEITGHCATLTVSGVRNTVNVEGADSIGASGFDNRVTYRSGDPKIDNAGDNVVEQG